MPSDQERVVPIGIASLGDERKQQVVNQLESFLREAKEGKYDEIFIVANLADEEAFIWAWTRCEDLVGMVGRLERLKQQVLRRMDP